MQEELYRQAACRPNLCAAATSAGEPCKQQNRIGDGKSPANRHSKMVSRHQRLHVLIQQQCSRRSGTDYACKWWAQLPEPDRNENERHKNSGPSLVLLPAGFCCLAASSKHVLGLKTTVCKLNSCLVVLIIAWPAQTLGISAWSWLRWLQEDPNCLPLSPMSLGWAPHPQHRCRSRRLLENTCHCYLEGLTRPMYGL